MKIGVIGVGVISTAVVKALEEKLGDSVQFFLSPRNAQKAAQLCDGYDNVSVMRSNQAVVDNCEIVVLAVLPEIAREVVSSLKFSADQHIVSLISEPKVAELAEWIGQCKTLTRVVPLTFIENRVGPIAVFPGTDIVCNLLDGLGTVVVADNETSFTQLQILTALPGAFFYLMDELVRWAEKHGESRGVTAAYLFSLFSALADQGQRTAPEELSELWEEMTPGGLNEDVMKVIQNGGGFSLWLKALDKVRQRVL
jgi:Pyrroline-5-carboxylate reductase